MLKQAYELGINLALEEAGVTKQAFWGALASRGAQFAAKHPGLGRAGAWALEHPLAASTAGGAAVGGVAGGLGDQGVLRGAAMGAATGAALRGGQKFMMNPSARAGESLMRDAGANLLRAGAKGKNLGKLTGDADWLATRALKDSGAGKNVLRGVNKGRFAETAGLRDLAQYQNNYRGSGQLLGAGAGAVGGGALGYGMMHRDEPQPWYKNLLG